MRYQRVLDFITAYFAEHGHAPTLQEVADGVGYASKSSAHNAVWALITTGSLTGSPGRSLRLGVPSEGGGPPPPVPRPRSPRRQGKRRMSTMSPTKRETG